MSVIYILLPLALIFSAIAVAIFIWATRDGQFDDLETPGMRVLLDEEPKIPVPPTSSDHYPQSVSQPEHPITKN